jgi:HK97 family phage portal protein
MGLIDAITNAFRTSPKNVPSESSAAIAVNDGYLRAQSKVGKTNTGLYRGLAEHSEWVRAAINVRKTQVSQSEWDIVKFDPTGPDPDPVIVNELRDLFNNPNPKADSFRSFVEPIIEDVLVLDAGCVEKERRLNDRLVHLWPVDGATIKVSAIWDGNPDEYRYFWYPDNYERARFRNRDFIYIMESPTTYRVVGLSKLETLKQAVDAELSGHFYNYRQVTNAAPDGMLDLGETARQDQVDAFKSYWDSEISGRGAMAILGGSKNPKFIPFRGSNRDMQFLEWQLYLIRKIAAVFGISPQDLGVTYDINRATADVQSENTEDRGLRPLLGIIQNYFTKEVVWDDSFGGQKNNLAFRFTRLNLKESLSRAQINKLALAGVSWKTINEARLEDGREPLDGEHYNSLMVITPTGAVTLDGVPTAEESLSSRSKPTNEPSQSPPPPPRKEVREIRPLTPTKNGTQRETKFKIDQNGRVIGKVEYEYWTDLAGQDHTRAVETQFQIDDGGRIVGKIEFEVNDGDD